MMWWAIIFALLAGVAAAEGPDATTRPIARGEDIGSPPTRPALRPHERPSLQHGAGTLPIYRAEQGLFAFSPDAVATSLRPTERPAKIEQAAIEARAEGPHSAPGEAPQGS